MQVFAGCALPEEYLYDLELDVWVRLDGDGSVRMGMTDVAQTLCGKLVSLTFQKHPGDRVRRRRTLVVIESAKWVGPFRSPLSGEVLEVNERAFRADQLLANRDPYGEGWIAKLRPTDWDGESGDLVTGAEGVAAYEAFLEQEGISCEEE